MSVDAGSWDFRDADVKCLTHGLHVYPAVMIPQIARRLIGEHGRTGDVLFDPYCGSGTSLLEGKLAGLECVGTDLNPLARLIARVKSCDLNLEAVREVQSRFEKLKLSFWRLVDTSLPTFPNVDFWFSRQSQYDLAAVLKFVDGILDSEVKDFFRVIFSAVVREVSWAKKSEFKLVKMSADERHSRGGFVWTLMSEKLEAGIACFERLQKLSPSGSASVHDFDSVIEVPDHVLPSESVDIVVTSPPYGDSRTTVAYGQFSRLSSQWLGLADPSSVDGSLMGGKKAGEIVSFDVSELDSVVEQIAERNTGRALDVCSFFDDYRSSIGNVAGVVKPGGKVCYVVGNRSVQGLTIPTDVVTRRFFEMEGFKLDYLAYRNIPRKRMPRQVSPSNVVGSLEDTMSRESVIVLRKK